MLCFPNAKINLGLNIIGKRPDGYHDIETVLYPIPVKDALEVTPAEATAYTGSGLPIDVPAEKNLAMKAWATIKQRYKIPELNIWLLKGIPSGAGLGGGSADAGFMLKAINNYADLKISDDELEILASTLGADCAFFVRNRPVFAAGIGNTFRPIRLSLSGWHLCLVVPDVKISTKDAYSRVTPGYPAISLSETIKRPVEEWKDRMVNDFEKSVFPSFPVIREIKEKLYEFGAVYASMTGSGSAVYGLFSSETHLRHHFHNCFFFEGQLE